MNFENKRHSSAPTKTCSADLYRHIKRKNGRGSLFNEHTARGIWSLPESKLHINYLELKVGFLALKEFQNLCKNSIVLTATDNTTVEGG